MKGEPYRLPSFMASWENVARLMQPTYNEKFLLRIGDFATERQQLLSLRVLFLCRLGKDTKVPSFERIFAQVVSSMKEPEGLISTNRAALPGNLGLGSSEPKCHLRNESKLSLPKESRARPGVFSLKLEWA